MHSPSVVLSRAQLAVSSALFRPAEPRPTGTRELAANERLAAGMSQAVTIPVAVLLLCIVRWIFEKLGERAALRDEQQQKRSKQDPLKE